MRRNRRYLVLSVFFVLLLLLSGCRDKQTPFTFLFFSDAQADPETGDYTGFGELISFAARLGDSPKLAIFGGDTVNDGGDAAEWAEFWQSASAPLSGLTLAAVPGNHDNYALLAGQFDYPAKAPENPGEGFFYSFDMGQIHFIMLDSNIMGAANQADIEWLERDLQSDAARKAAWRIAVMHHPMWPVVENPKDMLRAETMREHFLPLLETYGVELILCGHQHVYARSRSMSGIVQIMAASGGKESYTAGGFDYIACTAPAPNFLLLRADDKTLTVTAYDSGGEVCDSYVLTR